MSEQDAPGVAGVMEHKRRDLVGWAASCVIPHQLGVRA